MQPNAFEPNAGPHDQPDQKPVSTAKPHIHAPVDNPAWSHRVGENPEEAGEEQRERKARRSLQKDGSLNQRAK